MRPAPLALVAPFVLYAGYSAARSDLRVEHLLVLAAVAALALIGPRTWQLLLALYPFALVGIFFDGMRPFQTLGLTEARVLLCDLRAAEARWFGWEAQGELLTLHDFFRVHHTTALDVFCAIPYATFILWCVAGAVFLYVKDRPAMKRFGWAFVILNVSAFVTYHVLPAAPPWYFHEHGCVVDLATKASAGPVLTRVDHLLGIAYFQGMYSKASSVFGALPSLHCAYPLLILVAGWRAYGPRLRAAGIAYYLAMVFAAIYLDHHWVLDALMGSVYALLAAGAVHLAWAVRRERSIDAAEGTTA